MNTQKGSYCAHDDIVENICPNDISVEIENDSGYGKVL